MIKIRIKIDFSIYIFMGEGLNIFLIAVFSTNYANKMLYNYRGL